MKSQILNVEPLTASAFEPFGDVIETEGRAFHHINARMVERYHDLAHVDVEANGGRTGVSVLLAQPYALPMRVAYVERHPLSSQAFIPLSDRPFLVIVGGSGDIVAPSELRAFITNGRQGVNYRRGVWHHVLLAIRQISPFVAIDRLGNGPNCDRSSFAEEQQPVVLDPQQG